MARVLPMIVVLLLTLSVSIIAFPLDFSAPVTERDLRSHSKRHVRVKVHTETSNDDHVYFRPTEDVSGFPNNTKTYHRAPCPFLNMLANHGYIARDGKKLTPQLLKQNAMELLHFSDAAAHRLVRRLPPSFTLADLGTHNFIEHDASMIHDDVYFGQDPSHMNTTLANQLLARATKDGQLTSRVIAGWRHDREAHCAKINPQYGFGFKRQRIAYAEAAGFLLGMGDSKSESISVAHFRSFLVDERMPDDFVRSTTEISDTHVFFLAAKIKAMAVVS